MNEPTTVVAPHAGLVEAVQDEIRTLPGQQQQLMVGIWFYQKSVKEMAVELGMEYQSAWRLYHETKRAIVQALQKDWPELVDDLPDPQA